MLHITVEHGSLVLNIPCSVFVSGSSDLSDTADEYFSMLMRRYPWLSKNSITVIRKNASKAMQRIIDERMRGPERARMLSHEGKDMEAVRHLESYLTEFPEDADAWYALGETLCKMGRNDEGYKAMNHGRRFF